MLASLLTRSRDTSEPQGLTAWGPWNDSSRETWSGQSVSVSSSLQLLTVYGCNSFICDGISTMPVDVFRKSGGTPVEVTTPAVLENPTPDLDIVSWMTQALTSLLLAGNFYGFREFNGNVGNSAVHPLDPAAVQVRREDGRKVFYVNGEKVPTPLMMHVPGPMFPGTDVGMSPIDAARQTIGMGMAAQEQGAKHFGQGMTLSGVIELPGEMDPQSMREMAREWQRKHGGSSKSGLPGVLKGGAQWKPTQLSNEAQQFLETRQYTDTEIAAKLFHIDPVEMGLPVMGTSLTYANQEERNIHKVQVTFLPWIVRLEKAMTSMIARGQYAKLNVNALLRGDTKSRYEAYRIALGDGVPFAVVDEVRELEDRGPMPAGQTNTPPEGEQ